MLVVVIAIIPFYSAQLVVSNIRIGMYLHSHTYAHTHTLTHIEGLSVELVCRIAKAYVYLCL